MGKLIASAKPGMMSASKDAGLRNLGRPMNRQASMMTRKLAMGGMPPMPPMPQGAPMPPPQGMPPMPPMGKAPAKRFGMKKMDDGGLTDPVTMQDGVTDRNDFSRLGSTSINIPDVPGMTPNTPTVSKVAGISDSSLGSMGAVGTVAAGVINAADPKNVYGVQSSGGAAASGALSGAGAGMKAGASFGPAGAAIGAGLGAISGALFGARANNKAMGAQKSIIQQQETNVEKGMADQSNARLSGNSTAITGAAGRSLYARKGGLLKHHSKHGAPDMHQLPPMSQGMPGMPPGAPQGMPPGMPQGMPPQGMPPGAMPQQRDGGLLNKFAKGGRVQSPGQRSAQDEQNYLQENNFTREESLDKNGMLGQIVPPGGGFNERVAAHLNPERNVLEDAQRAGPVMGTHELLAKYSGGAKEAKMGGMLKKPVMGMPKKGMSSPVPPMPLAPGQGVPGQMPPMQMADGGITPSPGNMATKPASGGSLVPMSKHTSMVKGPSHEGGGVGVPSMNAEVEGGETTSDNFVFSKELGFAKQHAVIAKALGEAEKKPKSLSNDNTVRILKEREDKLKKDQESTKAQMGMPNDSQAVGAPTALGQGQPPAPDPSQAPPDPSQAPPDPSQAPPQARNGGLLRKYADGGPIKYPQGSPANVIHRVENTISNNERELSQYNINRTNSQDQGGLADLKQGIMGHTSYMNTDEDVRRKMYRKDTTPNEGLTPPQGASTLADLYKPVSPYQSLPAASSEAPIFQMKGNPTPKYERGGLLRKYADGGKVPEEVPDVSEMPTQLPTSATSFSQTPETRPYVSPGIAPATGLTANQKVIDRAGNTAVGLGKLATSASPFMADIYNLNRRLPNSPILQEQAQVTPNLVDFSASRQAAQSQSRASTQASNRVLGSGAEIAAVGAANAASAIEANNKVNEAEGNANAQIRNQAATTNSYINARNVAGRNDQARGQVERMNAQQGLTSSALAQIGTKQQELTKYANDREMQGLDVQMNMANSAHGVSERDNGAIYDQLVSMGLLSKERRASMRVIGKARNVADDKQIAQMMKLYAANASMYGQNGATAGNPFSNEVLGAMSGSTSTNSATGATITKRGFKPN